MKKQVKEYRSGAWKLALADFAIAMMALFLLLWILNSTSDREKMNIAKYFEDPKRYLHLIRDLNIDAKINVEYLTLQGQIQQSQQRMLELQKLLEDRMNANIPLANYKEHVFVDIVNEGLRIQIFDRSNRSMFLSSSAEMLDFMQQLLRSLVRPINTVTNRIMISGHTDANLFYDNKYNNWELSSDRANSARRELVKNGLNPDRIAKVVGMGSTIPLDIDNPKSEVNRRISIVILNDVYDKNMIQQEKKINSKIMNRYNNEQ